MGGSPDVIVGRSEVLRKEILIWAVFGTQTLGLLGSRPPPLFTTKALCQPPPPPDFMQNSYYLWFAFVCVFNWVTSPHFIRNSAPASSGAGIASRCCPGRTMGGPSPAYYNPQNGMNSIYSVPPSQRKHHRRLSYGNALSADAGAAAFGAKPSEWPAPSAVSAAPQSPPPHSWYPTLAPEGGGVRLRGPACGGCAETREGAVRRVGLSHPIDGCCDGESSSLEPWRARC